MGIIFSWRALPGVDFDRPDNPENIIRCEDAGNGESSCVYLENVWLGWIQMLDDWCLSEDSFHLPERHFGLPCPLPFHFATAFCVRVSRSACWWLASITGPHFKVGQSMSHFVTFLEGPSVEVRASKKHLDISHWQWCRPVLDCGDSIPFHADSLTSDNKPQNTDLWYSKLSHLAFTPKAELHKLLQNMAHMLLMLLVMCQIDVDVNEVAYNKLVNQWP